MGLTARLHLPWPARTAAPDVSADMQALATALDVLVPYGQGLLADRPVSTPGSPGIEGRFYSAADTKHLYYDNGTGWTEYIPKATRSNAPPSSPVDGDPWVLPVSGRYWQFMYDPTETTYKWKCISPNPVGVIDLSFANTGGAYTLLGNGFVAPRDGIYRVRGDWHWDIAAAPNIDGYISPGPGPSDATAIKHTFTSNSAGGDEASVEAEVTAVAGDVIGLYGKHVGAAVVTSHRFISVVPVKII